MVADDLLAVVGHPVGLEQGGEIGGHVGAAAAEHGLLAALPLEVGRRRIDGDEHGLAGEQKLVDGELLGGLDAGGVEHGERGESARQSGEVGVNSDDIVGTLPLLENELGLGGTATLLHHHYVVGLACELQAGEDAELGLVELLDGVEEGGDVVFEQFLTMRAEGGEGLLLVGLSDNQTEVERFARAGNLLRLEPGGLRALLLGSVGRRGDDLEGKMTRRGADIGAQHLLHAVGVVFIRDRQAGDAMRGIETQRNGLLDFTEQRAGALGQGVDLAGGEVAAGRETGGEEIYQQQDGGEQDDGDGFDDA